MRRRTLKLVKMQSPNAPYRMLSMPSWRRMGHQREFINARPLILLSEVGMLNFFIDRCIQALRRNGLCLRPGPTNDKTSTQWGGLQLMICRGYMFRHSNII